MSPGEIFAELPALATEITAGTIAADVTAMPVSRVEHVWAESTPDARRVVFVP